MLKELLCKANKTWCTETSSMQLSKFLRNLSISISHEIAGGNIFTFNKILAQGFKNGILEDDTE